MQNSAVSKLAHEIRNRGFIPTEYAEDINAANWVLACLDPADSAGQNGAVLGIPDHNDQPSACIGWRQISSIAPDTVLALSSTDTWDFDMLTFEGPTILAAGQMRKSSDPTKFKNFWILNSMFNFSPNGVAGPGPAAQIDSNGNWSVVSDQVATNWMQNVAFFRPTHSSTTIEFVGATLTDQGTLVAAQQPNQWTLKPLSDNSIAFGSTFTPPTAISTTAKATSCAWAKFGTASVVGPTGLMQSTSVPDFDQLLMVSPSSRSWKAAKGAYLPLRYQQPSLEYLNTQSYGETPIVYHPWNVNGAPISGVSNSDTLPVQWLPAAPTTGVVVGPAITNSISRLMRAGAVCVRGVAPTTTFSVIFRNGYEVLPPPGGPWSANLTPSCKPCDRAVEAYFRLRHDLPDAFESSWNREGTLKKVVGSVASSVFGGKSKSSEQADTDEQPKGRSKGSGAKKLVSRIIAPSEKASEASSSKRPIAAAVKARRQKKKQQSN
jgi:hypothetical protein